MHNVASSVTCAKCTTSLCMSIDAALQATTRRLCSHVTCPDALDVNVASASLRVPPRSMMHLRSAMPLFVRLIEFYVSCLKNALFCSTFMRPQKSSIESIARREWDLPAGAIKTRAKKVEGIR